MPKVGKAKRAARIGAVIEGLPSLFGDEETLVLSNEPYTAEAIAQKLGSLLAAMAKVRELTIARSVAVHQERELEASLRPLLRSLASYAKAKAGEYSAKVRELGFEPDRKPRMTPQAKHDANVKRQATRRARGHVGKKRRGR